MGGGERQICLSHLNFSKNDARGKKIGKTVKKHENEIKKKKMCAHFNFCPFFGPFWAIFGHFRPK
jgi:hypothetical protein